ncbi:MAG: NAD-dependent succinate-semialdehyde dehydrogenase [Acidobacteria bacterium]|nr:NAD-dependent succinate-semialdehyde dehydrogenase [Acidobacteriota bacterium]
MAMESINPTTGETLASYPEHSVEQVQSALDAAATAFERWRRVAIGERADLARGLADVLDKRTDEWARLMTLEMGKPIAASRAEIAKCAWLCRYYADEAPAMLADRHIDTGQTRSYVHHEPLGVVLAVMPWNFPFWQVFRFAVPGLIAGNAGVLKHASNVSGCALAIEEAFSDAGYPLGVFQTILVPGVRVGEILEHPAVVAATLTGSETAGRALAAKAGALLKKTVLELGGSDPYLVLEDADVEAAAVTCAASRMINSGQSCIAAKRFIVHTAVYDQWLERFVAAMKSVRMGDPLDEEVGMGPMARVDLRDELHRQVLASVAAGATLALGGSIPDLPGAYYPATVLTEVVRGMPAYDEELFGPVAAVSRVTSEEEGIAMANDTPYGLGAAVFTTDLERGERIAAEHLEAGACFVNASVASDPRLPFGGIKLSGYGRELSDLGIVEFVNQKTVVVA